MSHGMYVSCHTGQKADGEQDWITWERSPSGGGRHLGVHITSALNNSDKVKGILGTGKDKSRGLEF